MTRRASSQGTIGSSLVVANTIASVNSVLTVATSVPAGSDTVSTCGADSQNVTRARAAVGGNSRTPSRSRNAR